MCCPPASIGAVPGAPARGKVWPLILSRLTRARCPGSRQVAGAGRGCIGSRAVRQREAGRLTRRGPVPPPRARAGCGNSGGPARAQPTRWPARRCAGPGRRCSSRSPVPTGARRTWPIHTAPSADAERDPHGRQQGSCVIWSGMTMPSGNHGQDSQTRGTASLALAIAVGCTAAGCGAESTGRYTAGEA